MRLETYARIDKHQMARINRQSVMRCIAKKAADFIGLALATTINIMDPDKIYLCGGVMKNGGEFLKLIREATLRRQMHQAGRKVMILPGSMEEWNGCGAFPRPGF